MNCSFCNNNMYDATIDCVGGTLMIEFISGSITYNNNMENWTNDEHCTLIHNDTKQYEWCVDCSILSGVE